jgi:hypothetical protein
MLKLIAVFVTLTASFMTAVAAWDRGGTLLDKLLLVAMSVVIVLAVHLLPAVSRRPAAWLVWVGCLLCAIYGHLTFLTHASLRAGDNLAQQSTLTVGTERQFKLTQDALAQITARPVSVVAAELALAKVAKVRSALREELSQGKKAEALREDLVKLSGRSTEAQVSGAADPVVSKLALALGVSEGGIMVTVGLTFAMLLELIGTLLWVEVLRPSFKKPEQVLPVTPSVTQTVTIPKAEKVLGVTKSVTIPKAAPVTPVTNSVTPEIVMPVTIVTEAVTPSVTNSVTETVTQITPAVTNLVTADPITQIRAAVLAGECKESVAGIRGFLGCSQSTAMELRRQLSLT